MDPQCAVVGMAPPKVEESTDVVARSANLTGRDLLVVVDDEVPVLRALERSLAPAFDVVTFAGAEQAIERVKAGGVSVVLSDIGMPGMSGLDLLGAIREYDPDLPVVLLTGAPSLESATRAIEHGVFRYLPKPFEGQELAFLLGQATQRHRLARLQRETLELRGVSAAELQASAEQSFETALESLWIAFQPIISLRERRVYGYEALMRSSLPAFSSPSHLLDAAERLSALDRLGRAVRRRAAEGLREAPEEALLFVNLHPHDLLDPELTAPSSPLVPIANRVVLEITERASLGSINDMQARIAALRALGFRIAIDDLGAGYAGLHSFVLLEPDIVKLDMSLIRGIDQSTIKQGLVRSIALLCRQMDITIVIEGVETMAELDALVSLGCVLLQGFLFARPGRTLPPLSW
jgi:EAL domain-containing protein (putative c-di-GMP-specific phosphodiesterase class I)